MNDAILTPRDMLTGQWAELRDMARDNIAARMMVDRHLLLRQRQGEDVLLAGVLHLLRENERLQKRLLDQLMVAPAQYLSFHTPPTPARGEG